MDEEGVLVGMSMGEWIVEYGRGKECKREGVVYWLVVERGGWRGCEWWREGWEGEEVMRKFLYYIGNAGLWQKCSGTGFVKQ